MIDNQEFANNKKKPPKYLDTYVFFINFLIYHVNREDSLT